MRTEVMERAAQTPRAGNGRWMVMIIAMQTLVVCASADAETALERRANELLGLQRSDLVILDIDPTPGLVRDIPVPIDAQTVVLHLEPHSLRADGYELKVQVGDGTYITAEPGPVRTVRGHVVGLPGSVVAGSVLPDGLTLLVQMVDGSRVWIESIGSRVEGALPGHHVVYHDADVLPQGGSCATEVNNMGNFQDGEAPLPEGAGCDFFPCVTQLGCDADVEYFNNYGSVTAVENRIHLITNTMNVQYERDVDITHEITTIIVRTAEPDPYSSSSAGSLLNQFRAHWLSQQQNVIRDVAELFTGKELNGGTIGIAFDIGAICTTNAFCLVQSDFNGSFNSATDLSAHELGHLWRAFHCSCPQFTMNPVITSANQFNPSGTVPSIVFHRNSRFCLDSATSPPSTPFPLLESFPTTDLNEPKWINSGAVVTELGAGEPSPPFSLTFNITDQIATGSLNATEDCDLSVDYWWQRTGNGGSPEPNEDLIVEYRGPDGSWEQIALHPGQGPDDQPFVQNSILLPAAAHHANLQVRWRLVNAESSDNFFIDDIRIGCPADATPAIVHGSGFPGETNPFSGYVDPRRESDDGVTLNQGLLSTRIRFNQPVFQCDGSPLTGDLTAFEITQTGGATPPNVVAVSYVDGDQSYVEVQWDSPLTLREWTTIRATNVCSSKGVPIANTGNLGVENEPDRIDLAFLPGDVDQSGSVNPLDLLKFKQFVNGVQSPAAGTLDDLIDTNRSGSVNPLDLLAFKQLINGVNPPATIGWAGQSLNNPRP